MHGCALVPNMALGCTLLSIAYISVYMYLLWRYVAGGQDYAVDQ